VEVAVPGRGTPRYPFSAIVGQEEFKLALLLNAIDPRVGGVLVRGEKGTAKSTAVRALGAVMPPLAVVEGCRFACDPADPPSWCDECRSRRVQAPLPRAEVAASLVELPVSATEDRLVGSLDLEHALKKGERRFEPGILARANRAILYVDEVNLLDDHLVDTLLDAAAMGVNTVEREGVSFRHPSRFILIGTMNPEEGELRPQLLDRFGLCVDVTGVRTPELRVEIMRRRSSFDSDPSGFAREWEPAQGELRLRIRTAQGLLPRVTVSDELLLAIANLALTVGVDGHRADQAMARAAAAHAALNRRETATLQDLATIAPLVLAHRTKRTLFDEPQLDAAGMAALIASALAVDAAQSDVGDPESGTVAPGDGQIAIWDAAGESGESLPTDGDPADMNLDSMVDRVRRSAVGRTQRSASSDSRGRHSSERPARPGVAAGDVALSATIREAASHQDLTRSAQDLAVVVDPKDLREKVRTRKVGATIVLCVDASSSMGAAQRVSAARAAVLDLLVDAYQRRDRVGMVAFRGESASVVLSPTASVQLAELRLRNLPTGGATPLAAGILTALDVLQREMHRVPETLPWLIIVSDGGANVGLDGGQGSVDALSAARRVCDSGIKAVFVDAGGNTTHTFGREFATAAGAQYVRLGGSTEKLGQTIRSRVLRS
jgi:magnesium chelatase subunit D